MIDLHLHSTASDGSESPSRIVELAVEAGCSTIALTDHDGMSGLAEARAAATRAEVGFVDGCEVSCSDIHGTIHLLVYFVTENGEFDRSLRATRDDRGRRNLELLDKLRWLGMPLDPDELALEAGGGETGRPHFAVLLVRHGYAMSIQDAFDRFLADGGAAYVPRATIAPVEVFERAQADGGVVAFAHPFSTRLDRSTLDRYIGKLADEGLNALECIYGRYDEDTRQLLVSYARRHGLVPTGGSDYHGIYKPDLSVGRGTGNLDVPDEVVDELRARRA